MENQNWAPRIVAALAYVVALLGAGSVFLDVWELNFVPTPRTWSLLAVQLLIVLVGRGAMLAGRGPTPAGHRSISVEGAFLRSHVTRGLIAHLLAHLLWLLPWGIQWSVGSGVLQREWLKIPMYFVLLTLVTLIAGLALPTYLIEAVQDALSGNVRESLRGRRVFGRRG